jgi:uncharacterized protein (TIGR03067 family)
MKRLVMLLPVILLLAADRPDASSCGEDLIAEDVVARDKARLKGTWNMTVLFIWGEERRPKPAEVQMVFEGNKITLKERRRSATLIFTLNPDARLAKMDIDTRIPNIKPLPAIYRLRGDTLEIRVNLDYDKRPQNFLPPKDVSEILAVLKRVKR